MITKARIFSLVDLRDFFFRYRVGGGGGGGQKRPSENDQSTGNFQIFFLFTYFFKKNLQNKQLN